MSIKTSVDLRAAFEGREVKAKVPTGEVHERIANDAPRPSLRPGGSWTARADEVDQRVREAQDAAKARNEWRARIVVRHRLGVRESFRRSSGIG